MSDTISLLLLISALLNQGSSQSYAGYQEPLAYQMLSLAAGAYGSEQAACVSTTFPASDQRYVYSTSQVQCDFIKSTCDSYIENSNVTRQVVFVFRGTKTESQLAVEGWQSYQMGEQFMDMGLVNRYFLKAHNDLWPSIEAFLQMPEFQSYSILVTGHSLGGALASLAAARIVRGGFRPASQVQLYTFGQPRTGGYDYAMAFDSMGISSFRVVYSSDVVPHQPECTKDMSIPANAVGSRTCLADSSNRAYHHGTEIWYPESMTPGTEAFRVCSGTPKNEDMNCSDALFFDARSFSLYAWQHRHYFDTFVTGFGKSGCTQRERGGPAPTSKDMGLEGLLGRAVNSLTQRVESG